ncbi:MAG TPA: carbohydrate-binding protein [Propionicimonas sp.]|uniref:chitinase n=1 Tax=Propionicimonas sp. TaxID=1955623 RepID=UPI002F3F7C5D
MSTRFPGRRFSWLRLTILVLLVALVGVSASVGLGWWRDTAEATVEGKPWFGGYVDVTATPSYAFETATAAGSQNAVLAFVVAAKDKTCTPTWGGAYSLDQASSDLDLDRRIARVRDQGRNVVVSFGGLLNDELALDCATVTDLSRAYAAVIDRYRLDTIDLDLEGVGLTDTVSGQRRADAVAQLQKDYRAKGRNLAVWLTLPVVTTGLSEDGTNAVAAFLNAGVDLAGVNAMTMNFGDTRAEGQSMADASIAALTAMQRQLGVLYSTSGTRLGMRSLWRKVGATPMLGQNDQRGQIFSLQDAADLNTFALQSGVGRMSVWSMNRDQPCSVNYPDITRVNDSCSGFAQGTERFAAALAHDFTGTPQQAAGAVTTPEPSSSVTEIVDDPATSPYPIWNALSSYPAGTKIVLRGNVYEAKWWTRGDVPDNPVLQEAQTPWRLIGPVLPGETPVPVPTLPADFYPTWKADVAYPAGKRVLYQGVAFEARWWNTATSPESSLVDPGGSPWAALSQEEIRKALNK